MWEIPCNKLTTEPKPELGPKLEPEPKPELEPEPESNLELEPEPEPKPGQQAGARAQD